MLHVPDWFINDVQKLFVKFLWSGKTPKVKYTSVIADFENGGLKLPDFRSKIKALKLAWIQRFFDGSKQVWKDFLTLACDNKVNLIIYAATKKKDLPINIGSFYAQVFDYWHEFYYKEPKLADDIRRTILWCNFDVLVDNKTVIYGKWLENGIICLRDICSDDGKILSLNEMAIKYNFDVDFMQYMSLRSAIPAEWKTMIRNAVNKNVTIDINAIPTVSLGKLTKNLAKVKSRDIYWHFVDKVTTLPTSKNKWVEMYKMDFDEIRWKYVYSLPHYVVIDTYLQSFQFKIIHRIFTCGRYLYKIGERTDSLCHFCTSQSDDDLLHYFYVCNPVKTFWSAISNFWRQTLKIGIVLNEFEILFGVYNPNNDYVLDAVNFMIILAKVYIYNCKSENVVLNLQTYCKRLKAKLDVTRCIAYNNGKKHQFDKKWGNILNFLTND